MATTIQIDEDTKKKLFSLKLQYSESEGRNVSYNEIINKLLNQARLKEDTIDRSELREFKGSLPKKTRLLHQTEKYKDFA